ncbi:MAG: thioredoxin domain-containing protein [Chloroflexia bacterium]
MPVLLLKDRCDHLPHCYAAGACPNQALFYDERSRQVVVFPERCGDCRGPCLNFCDRFALKFAPTLEELRLVQAELDGTMSAEEIAKERLRLRQEAESRARAAVPEVTVTTFQREVLQANLPVVVAVCTSRSSACRSLELTLQQLAQQFMGQVLFRRVDSDQEPQLVAALQVRSVPTLLFFYRGELVHGVVGGLSTGQLQLWIQDLLNQIRAVEEAQAKAVASAGGTRGPLPARQREIKESGKKG